MIADAGVDGYILRQSNRECIGFEDDTPVPVVLSYSSSALRPLTPINTTDIGPSIRNAVRH